MTKNPVGRPSKMGVETLMKLEQAFAYGATDSEACFYAGISRSTLMNYCTDNPGYSERKEMLKEQHFLVARETMLRGIKDDPKFALEYMKAKKKAEFASRTEVTGVDGAPVIDTGITQLKEIAKVLKDANGNSPPNEPARSLDEQAESTGTSESTS